MNREHITKSTYEFSNLPLSNRPSSSFRTIQARSSNVSFSILGGVQALGALAFGIEDSPPLDAVDMIVGPGNAYVAEAKRQLYGRVGIDIQAGPTEILVLADSSADPRLVAADLLGQAEHGPTSPAIAVTDSRELGPAILDDSQTVLAALARPRIQLHAEGERSVICINQAGWMRRHGDLALPSLVRTGSRRPAKRAWIAASTEDRPGIRSTPYVLGTTWLEDERACCLSPGRGYPCLSIIGQHSPLFRGKDW